MNMTFQQAVDKYFSDREANSAAYTGSILQPVRHRSVMNNRGWHLSNSSGYLGSINKRGEYFIVKSRETS
jgi:hypothetical protein